MCRSLQQEKCAQQENERHKMYVYTYGQSLQFNYEDDNGGSQYGDIPGPVIAVIFTSKLVARDFVCSKRKAVYL